jgi:DNA (cytosine-5)-methyltransferase 1
MSKNNNTLTQANKLIKPLATAHVPEESKVEAVIDQWLHAIATDSSFYCNIDLDTPENLKENIIRLLLNNGLFTTREAFYNEVFGNLKLKPDYNSKYRFIDLFAGIGGIRIAAQDSGGVCVFSSEFDSFAQDTYSYNHGEYPFGDIKNIQANNIPDHDLLLAGFPCQPFSYSGRSEGFEDKTRGTLFFDILRILIEKKPKFALLENVKGFKSHNKGETMHIALNSLEEAGYQPYWTILNSYDYGVPQYRERWYCVAIRKDLEITGFTFPDVKDRKTKLKDIVDLDEDDDSLSLTEFEKERIKFHFENYNKQVRVKHDNSIYEPHTKKGRHGVFSYLKNDGSLRFHVGDIAKTQIQEAFYACMDTYAPTIIANRVPKLWDIERKLSVKEALRLQGFPEVFNFRVSKAQSYKQIGNSVTVNVVSKIIDNITKMEFN